MRRLLPSCLASLLAASVSCTTGTSKEVTTAATDPAATTGAQTITARDLRRHVELLASDAYEGRETLQPGYEKAAEYIASEFARYGLTPMPGQDSMVVPYKLWQQGFETKKTHLSLTSKAGTKQLALGHQAAPFGFSDDGSLDADVVFAGYGITAKEASYDDYSGLDVKGKWVLVLRHAPGYRDPNSQFFGGKREHGSSSPDLRGHSAFRSKALNAQSHGAKGMLLVSGPVTAEVADDLRMPSGLSIPLTAEETHEYEAKLKERHERIKAAREKRAALAAGKSKGKARGKKPTRGKDPSARGGKAALPQEEQTLLAFHISSEVGTELIAKTGKSLRELQVAVDEGLKAKDVELDSHASGAVLARKTPLTVTGKNVIAYLEGSDSALRNEFVVVGGHFDHLGTTGVSNIEGKDTIYNGADDNASGTAGVLELAQAFASAPTAPRRSMLFIGFSGEERGLLGSRALVKQGPLDTSNVAFMLNLDMIGRNDGNPVEFVGGDRATDILAIAERAAKRMGVRVAFLSGEETKAQGAFADSDSESELRFLKGPYTANSDHHAFFKKEVPSAFFFTGLHDDYHGLEDHADKLDYPRMERIVRVGYGLAEDVANAPTRPSFIHKLDWLGASVNAGTIRAIEADSRATLAGLKLGDRIAKIGSLMIENGRTKEPVARSAGRVLADLAPGTAVAVDVVRDGKSTSLTLERAKRGYLGIRPGRLSDEDRQRHSIDASEGVRIGQAVEDAPASKSGLKNGDIITKLGGHSVNGSTLMQRLSRIGSGETITVQVIRDGKRIEMPLTLGEPPIR